MLSREAALWAAVLRAGRDAALSHQTAAELLRLTHERSGMIHLTVPLARSPGPIRGAVVHRSGRVAAATHPAQVPPRTRAEETTIDLTQSAVSFDGAYDWVCRAVSERLTTTTRLRAVAGEIAEVMARRGAPVLLRPCSPTCPVRTDRGRRAS